VTALWVALGAAVGAPLRYAVGRRLDGPVPLGTLVVNLVGSLLLGMAVGWSIDGSAAALVAVGFCGGLTTYSAFAVQTRDLDLLPATLYAVATIGLGLLACALGYLVTA
jgi:CrcB protein